jgi:hypothetical protein
MVETTDHNSGKLLTRTGIHPILFHPLKVSLIQIARLNKDVCVKLSSKAQ